jgi:hypothetical protein
MSESRLWNYAGFYEETENLSTKKAIALVGAESCLSYGTKAALQQGLYAYPEALFDRCFQGHARSETLKALTQNLFLLALLL